MVALFLCVQPCKHQWWRRPIIKTCNWFRLVWHSLHCLIAVCVRSVQHKSDGKFVLYFSVRFSMHLHLHSNKKLNRLLCRFASYAMVNLLLCRFQMRHCPEPLSCEWQICLLQTGSHGESAKRMSYIFDLPSHFDKYDDAVTLSNDL